jgi:hypothetical protein
MHSLIVASCNCSCQNDYRHRLVWHYYIFSDRWPAYDDQQRYWPGSYFCRNLMQMSGESLSVPFLTFNALVGIWVTVSCYFLLFVAWIVSSASLLLDSPMRSFPCWFPQSSSSTPCLESSTFLFWSSITWKLQEAPSYHWQCCHLFCALTLYKSTEKDQVFPLPSPK